MCTLCVYVCVCLLRDPRASNHLYNVAQTLHLARPDIVALQCVGQETTPAKLAALLNLWAEPHDGTWMAAVVPPVAAQQHGAQQGAGAVGAPTHLQAFLWREQPQVRRGLHLFTHAHTHTHTHGVHAYTLDTSF